MVSACSTRESNIAREKRLRRSLMIHVKFMPPNGDNQKAKGSFKKVQIGNDQEMVQSERNSHSSNRGIGKNKLTLKYLFHENMS